VEGRQPPFGVLGGDHGMNGRTRRWAAPALVAVLALTVSAVAGCSADADDEPAAGDEPTTTPTTAAATPTPPPAAPVPGACYRISYDEAVAPTNDDETLPCTEGHTSQTFAVGGLDLVVNGHLLAIDSDTVQRQVAKRCPRRLAPYLGANPKQLRLTMLRPVWFTPTIEQSDAGAGWYRCDVIAVTGDSKLAKLDSDLSRALKNPTVRASYGMCGTAQPGTKSFSHVLCREDHSWRAVSVVDLGRASKDGSYPGAAAVRRAGEDGTCADAAREVAADALDYQWGYEWPTADQWGSGQTYGRCWAPDPA
jgi:hypothetical protein